MALCNPAASWSPRASWLVIDDIESGAHAYVIDHVSGVVPIHVVDGAFGPYLRTDPDRAQRNNLDDLPLCSASTVPLQPNLPVYLGNYPDERSGFWTSNIQGVTHDKNYWFISQTRRLWRIPIEQDLNVFFLEFDFDHVFVVEIPDALRGLGYNHFGDLDILDGHLLVPIERPDDIAAIAAFRADDLTLVDIAYLPGESTQVGQRKAGWCAIRPDTGHVFTSESTLNDRNPIRILSVDRTALAIGNLILTPVGILQPVDENAALLELEHMQGGVFGEDGRLYLVNGYLTGHDPKLGGIRIIDPETGRLIARSSLEDAPFKFEYHHNQTLGVETIGEEPEGLTWWDLDDDTRAPGISGQLHVFLLDNEILSTDQIYFKHYRVNS